MDTDVAIVSQVSLIQTGSDLRGGPPQSFVRNPERFCTNSLKFDDFLQFNAKSEEFLNFFYNFHPGSHGMKSEVTVILSKTYQNSMHLNGRNF